MAKRQTGTATTTSSFDQPYSFTANSTAQFQDIYQIDGSEIFFGTGGYVIGAYYICINENGVTDIQASLPPTLGIADANGNWAHAWDGVTNTGFYLDGNAQRVTNAGIYANGNHCVGMRMYFDPISTHLNNDIIAPTQAPAATRFQAYMEALLGITSPPWGWEKKVPTLALNDGSQLPQGWASSVTPTAYTEVIIVPPSEAVPQREEEGGPAESVLGGWRPLLYLTSTVPGQITIEGQLTLPDSTVVKLGDVVSTYSASPIQVTGYPSNAYAAGASGGLAISPTRAPSSQNLDMDTYCLTHADCNPLSPEFYWRQDNYQISIDNKISPINGYGAVKKMVDWSLDGASIAKGQPSDPLDAYYYTSQYNYYNTDAYIYWSGTPDVTIPLWDDLDDNPIIPTGRDDGSIVIILMTFINLVRPFCQTPSGRNGLLGIKGYVQFHDQYGNPGEFYLNFKFPETYYPKGYDPNEPVQKGSRSIVPIYDGSGQNVLSYFYDIIIQNYAGTPNSSSQYYAYWYSMDAQKWGWVNPKDWNNPPSGYYNTVLMGPGMGNPWRFGPSLQGESGRLIPNGAQGLYAAHWNTTPSSASDSSWWVGISEAMGAPYGQDYLAQADGNASKYVYLRPIWTSNGFRLWHKDNNNMSEYLWPDQTHSDGGNAIYMEYAVGAPPGPGATWASFRFVKTPNGIY